MLQSNLYYFQSPNKCVIEKSKKQKQKCEVLEKGLNKLAISDRTELRTIFRKIKLADFLLAESDYDFNDSLRLVSNETLQFIQMRLDDLQNVFILVRCAMRHEKNFCYKEDCLKQVFEDHFCKMSLLNYFCFHNNFDFRFIQMDMLCNFRRFQFADIEKIIKRLCTLHDNIQRIVCDNYRMRSFPL